MNESFTNNNKNKKNPINTFWEDHPSTVKEEKRDNEKKNNGVGRTSLVHFGLL
jgi:hypothetical protein